MPIAVITRPILAITMGRYAHVAMAAGPDDLERGGGQLGLALQLARDAQLDLLREVGDVCDGPLSDLAVIAVALADQRGDDSVAVPDALDVHLGR